MSYLHDLIRNGNRALLLDTLRDADPEQLMDIINETAGKDGDTALHLAVKQGWEDAARALIRHGADVNSKDAWGETPLAAASRAESLPLAQLLLDAGANPDARRYGTADISVLHAAIEAKDMEMTKLLVRYGAGLALRSPEKDENGRNAFHYAAAAGYDFIDLLLQQPGADAAHAFANDGEKTVSALRIALENGDRRMAERLLDWGAGVNETDDNGENALFYLLAHRKSREEAMPLVHMLLRRGADVDKAKNYWDENALFPALHASFTEAVELLLDLGVDPNHQSHLRDTPLHIVAGTWDGRAARMLLKAGAETEVPNRVGRTPLHVAAHANKLDVVRALLDAGADPFATERDGKKPSDLAPAPYQQQVRRLLLQKEQEIEIRKYGHAMYNRRQREAAENEKKQKPRYKNHSSHPFQNRR